MSNNKNKQSDQFVLQNDYYFLSVSYVQGYSSRKQKEPRGVKGSCTGKKSEKQKAIPVGVSAWLEM